MTLDGPRTYDTNSRDVGFGNWAIRDKLRGLFRCDLIMSTAEHIGAQNMIPTTACIFTTFIYIVGIKTRIFPANAAIVLELDCTAGTARDMGACNIVSIKAYISPNNATICLGTRMAWLRNGSRGTNRNIGVKMHRIEGEC